MQEEHDGPRAPRRRSACGNESGGRKIELGRTLPDGRIVTMRSRRTGSRSIRALPPTLPPAISTCARRYSRWRRRGPVNARRAGGDKMPLLLNKLHRNAPRATGRFLAESSFRFVAASASRDAAKRARDVASRSAPVVRACDGPRRDFLEEGGGGGGGGASTARGRGDGGGGAFSMRGESDAVRGEAGPSRSEAGPSRPRRRTSRP